MLDFDQDQDLIDWLTEIRGWADASIPATLAEQIRFGDSPEQVIDLWQPAGGIGDRLVVSIHGGGFAADYRREINEPIVRRLTALGFVVANLEYRRTGSGGGFEATTEDIDSALSLLGARADLGAGRCAVVGHSAGGYLALWAAAHEHVDLAVALSPVTDLIALQDRDDDTVREWMGASSEDDPALYRRADLARRSTAGTQVVIMHGEFDTSVPVEHSVAFGERTGLDRIEVLENEGHFGWLDPRLPASEAVQEVFVAWRMQGHGDGVRLDAGSPRG